MIRAFPVLIREQPESRVAIKTSQAVLNYIMWLAKFWTHFKKVGWSYHIPNRQQFQEMAFCKFHVSYYLCENTIMNLTSFQQDIHFQKISWSNFQKIRNVLAWNLYTSLREIPGIPSWTMQLSKLIMYYSTSMYKIIQTQEMCLGSCLTLLCPPIKKGVSIQQL